MRFSRWPSYLKHKHNCELGEDPKSLGAGIHQEWERKTVPGVELLVSTSRESHSDKVSRGDNQENVVGVHLSNFEGQGPQSNVSEKSYRISPRISPFEYKENQEERQMKGK